MSEPTGTIGDGRDSSGRFAKGNPGGPGNPYSRRVASLRRALLEAVTEEDIQAIARALVDKALSGDVPAVRELLSRLLGPPEAIDLVQRVEGLEELLNAHASGGGAR